MSDRWPALRSRGGDAALWVAAGLLLVSLAALVFGGSRDPGPQMLVFCVLAAVLATAGGVLLVLACGYQRLAYCLTETALRIEWLGGTFVVPYAAMSGIYTGQRLSGHAMPSAVRWPGISVGPARVRGMGRLRFFATSTDQSALTFITVEHGGVIVSARDPLEFRAALIERVEYFTNTASPEEAAIWHQSPPRAAPWTALRDVWLPVGVAFGIISILVVLAVIASRFDALPEQIPLHFDAGGQPTQIAPKGDLVRLPLFGLICLAIDAVLGVWVHPREVLLARLLWLGGAAVQVVLLIGVLRLVA